jgi:hypothetical protein
VPSSNPILYAGSELDKHMLFVRKDATKLNTRTKQDAIVLDDFVGGWELTFNQ